MDMLKELLDKAPAESHYRLIVESYIVGLRAALERAIACDGEPEGNQAARDIVEWLHSLPATLLPPSPLPEPELEAKEQKEPADGKSQPLCSGEAGAAESAQDLQLSAPESRIVDQESISESTLPPDEVNMPRASEPTPVVGIGRQTRQDSPRGAKLRKFFNQLVQDKEVKSYVGKLEWSGNADEELWNDIQRCLLRMPRAVSMKWEAELEALLPKYGSRCDHSGSVLLYGSSNKSIYPGLSGKLRARGLGLSPDVQPPIDYQSAKDVRLRPALSVLAESAGICLHFVRADRNIANCLESLNRYKPIIPQNDEEKERYSNSLLLRFKEVVEGNENPAQAFMQTVKLAEAIFSLVYMPPADRDNSWWGNLHYETFLALQNVAREYQADGLDIKLQWLAGKYEDIYHRTGKTDLFIDSDHKNKRVVACLRPFILITSPEGPLETLGRVIYR